MNAYGLTQSDLDMLIKLVNGEDFSALDTDIPHKLVQFSSDVQKAVLKYGAAMRIRNARLNEKYIALRDEAREQKFHGTFPCSEADIVDIAKAVTFTLQKYGKRYTDLTVHLLLFKVYAVWLASAEESLFVHKPQAQPQGPWFWHLKDRFNCFERQPIKVINNLPRKKDGLANIIENVVKKYSAYSDTDLQMMFRNRNAAYINADREHNDGKWNKELSDNDIYNYEINKQRP